mmetsp:Transcript_3835/g.5439  ORF Transcript_3835/g.5439 Transcript_3835/m.5439 type:complete len:694 (-) Transcript_3835:111-2192(-)|eukprot:CAMPEP_0184480884 /NCGR_PEP_ID=MMETSP0113_2-20130426/2398_1 /TAXON_ID=91329 /ORGANISM="Norrisiella sphaerica, Strain BC52" /LENGTH=693 /DNA_ID=CAMNT_0026859665 /DNA_START=9 /DNA_END=2090 /DNA_ORIENTATION=+
MSEAKAPSSTEPKNKGFLATFKFPDFVAHRMNVWDELYKKQEESRTGGKEIKVTLPDGKIVDGQAGKTTPYDIAMGISAGLAKAVTVAKVNDKVWDLTRPLEDDCKLELCKFDSEDGSYTFWHSSAHILGEALELKYGCKLTVGPPTNDRAGFYYDAYMDGTKQANISEKDFKELEKLVQQIVKSKQPFQRLVLKKEDALEMFKFNKFKQILIKEKVQDGTTCTAYRCGPLIDLCTGPHIPNTGVVKAFAITKNSAAYWKGDAKNDSVQRVYGVSFPDKKKMKEHLRLMKEAAERDHRKIGLEQKLFFFDIMSPGSCFFLPHGTRIYNKLISFIRSEYRKRGFQEVITPNIYNCDLWKTSGHYANYRDDMFLFESADKEEFGMKPMNCPGHCVMFKHFAYSYKDLPMRYADFGVLHRNEKSGSLTGLTRVRRFQQDDAHIFCAKDQIFQEVKGALEFMKYVYDAFGFKFHLNLSTRPEKYVGEVKVWDEAEKQLEQVLEEFSKEHKMKWDFDKGGGAFYGPKIDIQLEDALKRKHQCATVQLDFQLPKRFGLKFKRSNDLMEEPVIVHRAILGSVERMFAVLCEQWGGKWPLWLSPRQVCIVPVTPDFVSYAEEVGKELHEKGYYVDVDAGKNQFKKKIREASVSQYNYILVVGAKERDEKKVNVRTRGNQVLGAKTMPEFIKILEDDIADFK